MKSVLITGAYGGMGRQTALCLRDRGYLVFALDLKTGEAEEGILPITADVTDAHSVEAAFRAVKEKTDRIDFVLHFAGLYMLDSLVEISENAMRRIFDVNFHGVFLVNKIFLPLLGKGSRILITTSELAVLDPLPFTGIYAVTKGALDKYAYSLRMELQLLGITVSVLRAGAVRTDMLGVSTDALDRFCQSTALYACNAKRFKKIVERVEARCVPPEKIAKKCGKLLEKRKLKFAYAINRNPLLLLFECLPRQLRFFIIRQILR